MSQTSPPKAACHRKTLLVYLQSVVIEPEKSLEAACNRETLLLFTQVLFSSQIKNNGDRETQRPRGRATVRLRDRETQRPRGRETQLATPRGRETARPRGLAGGSELAVASAPAQNHPRAHKIQGGICLYIYIHISVQFKGWLVLRARSA